MSREILCRQCGDKHKPHPEDTARGMAYRKTYLSAETPEGHGLTINGQFHPLSDLICDHCGELVSGTIAVAVSIWDSGRGVMSFWEPEYGQVLTPEAVALADKLSSK